ncbi:unnamed protein product [Diabrotica balteata]|uniref:Immunoglobulin V-set domain-containing protein n=1 Tax=Diabrotica balteata TaxID=107213 RepID=A0A9N9STY8_DIABA|nr:unnamed protein product [Diabrotica balteata]
MCSNKRLTVQEIADLFDSEQFWEDFHNEIVDRVYIEPPENREESDEDSGDESGSGLDNLSGKQLQADRKQNRTPLTQKELEYLAENLSEIEDTCEFSDDSEGSEENIMVSEHDSESEESIDSNMDISEEQLDTPGDMDISEEQPDTPDEQPLAVSWIRHRDIHILTVASYTYTSDQRFQANHHPETDDWTLQIKWAQKRDAGTYECEMPAAMQTGSDGLSNSSFNIFALIIASYLYTSYYFSDLDLNQRSWR